MRKLSEILLCISPNAIHENAPGHARHWIDVGQARAIYRAAIYLQKENAKLTRVQQAAESLSQFFRKTVGVENAMVRIVTTEDVVAAAVAERLQQLDAAIDDYQKERKQTVNGSSENPC